LAIEVVIPMLGVTVETGTIIEWLKQEGDTVEKGESIFAVEADKVNTEVESPASGVLAKILLPEGQNVPVLTVVAVITEPGEAVPEKYLGKAPLAPTDEVAEAPVAFSASKQAVVEKRPAASGTVSAVPAARWLARDENLELSMVQGSGPDGVIQYSDVVVALKNLGTGARVSGQARRLAAGRGVSLDGVSGSGVRGRVMTGDVNRAIHDTSQPQLGSVIPMNSMRQVIARRMGESKFTAPHIYFFSDINMDPLLAYRKQIVSEFETLYGLRPSINDFLIKAVALTIAEMPIMNSVVQGNEVYIQPAVNVCLAVALPDGLITPAIADADLVGLADVVKQRKDLVRRAKTNKLDREELERGTFTISSLASFDINYFTAIINPPQCGILSVAQTRDSLYLDNEQVKARQIATFGLSVDHRIIDGVVAAEFLQTLKSKLEKPAFTFMHI
jgi:pyruvate dehydrogenase E2 component (dihydrolipoamide acetyltransferase)